MRDIRERDMLRLRPYQREAVDKIHDAHRGGIKGYPAGMDFPAVVIPPGGGKTVIFAYSAAEHMQSTRTRVLVLVHRDELADQAMAKLRTVAPSLNIGKVKADWDDIDADVIVASVQTLSRSERLARLVESQSVHRAIGLIITDEVHHAVASSYQKIYAAFPGVRKAGFTATLARGDGVGLGSVITDVVYSRSWLWMINKGYLVDPVGRTVVAEELDLRRVGRSGNDYSATSLGSAMINARAHEVIASAYGEHAGDRSGIVFTPSVSAAYLVSAELDKINVISDVVESSTPRDERLSIYRRSRKGDLQVIVNCGVLTEGADFPWISCVVPRITQSAPLFQQMVGRALRPYPGKTDALVLSIGGMSGRLRTLVDLEPGAVREVRPGETLTEAAAREEAEDNRRTPASAKPFRITHRDASMFAGSRSMWLRTVGGVYFIPVADGEIFLWPQRNGLWQVRHAPKNITRLKLVWPVLRSDLTLDMAMAWGETEAEDMDSAAISTRSASWRRKKDPPTDGQISACRYYEIDIPANATKVQVSDLLSVRLASLKFDPFMARTEEYA